MFNLTFIYLLKQNRVIVLDEIHESYPGVHLIYPNQKHDSKS